MRSRAVIVTSRNREQVPSKADAAIRQRLDPLGVTFTRSPSLVLGAALVVAIIGAGRFGGVIGVVGVAAVLCALWFGLEPITVVVARRRSDRVLPELALRLARSLRSGRPPEKAIEQVASEMEGRHQNFAVVATHILAGRPVMDALDAWLHRSRGDAEQLLAAGLLLGVRQGGDLAVSIDGVGEGVRDDLDLDARRRVLLTQSRLSAAVLVALPVVFALVASGLQGGLIYEGRLGLGLLGAGLILDVLGICWMRALMRGLR